MSPRTPAITRVQAGLETMVADDESFEQATDQAQLIMNRLFGIGLDLNLVLSQTADSPGREYLQRAIDALDETIQDVRALAVGRLPR